MTDPRRPRSLLAERAVRHLAEVEGPVSSRALLRLLLTTSSTDERTATRILAAAFSDDPRLDYGERGWELLGPRAAARTASETNATALVWIDVEPSPTGRGYRLSAVAVVRNAGGRVVEAVAGAVEDLASELRSAVLGALADAIPVVHAPDGALEAFERWLEAPLGVHVDLRRLAADRLGLPAGHGLEDLAGALGLSWRDTTDPVDRLDTLEAALEALRGPGEDVAAAAEASRPRIADIDWRRVAFDREFLASIPEVPGTYRFFDASGALLYVGKSRNLRRRVGSYFLGRASRSKRRQALPGRVHRIEVDPTGSDLEAVLAEARRIERDRPTANVQRAVHASRGARSRLDSILILEPDFGPAVLRAYLVREGRFVARVRLGPRGGGLRAVERALRTWFFEGPPPASAPRGSRAVDSELLARWIARHRDRVVAFDPRDLGSADEVIARLRWFLERGTPFDPDGSPIVPR